jgi:hypothetical protein
MAVGESRVSHGTVCIGESGILHTRPIMGKKVHRITSSLALSSLAKPSVLFDCVSMHPAAADRHFWSNRPSVSYRWQTCSGATSSYNSHVSDCLFEYLLGFRAAATNIMFLSTRADPSGGCAGKDRNNKSKGLHFQRWPVKQLLKRCRESVT